MAFKKATKENSRARIVFQGPSGSGKSHAALMFAHVYADGGLVAVIDTERGRSRKLFSNQFEFVVSELTSFEPETYIKEILIAEQMGVKALVIDSLSHAWFADGGVLTTADALKKTIKNDFNAIAKAKQPNQKLLEVIMASSMHIMATMRTKTEYVVEMKNGRMAPRRVGIAPVQVSGAEYEFDMIYDIEQSHMATIAKGPSDFDGQEIPLLTESHAMETFRWFTEGDDPVHWIDKPEGTEERFWKWVESKGATKEVVLKALNCEADVREYRGAKASAMHHIETAVNGG